MPSRRFESTVPSAARAVRESRAARVALPLALLACTPEAPGGADEPGSGGSTGATGTGATRATDAGARAGAAGAGGAGGARPGAGGDTPPGDGGRPSGPGSDGTPARGDGGPGTPGTEPVLPLGAVVISELMYHPVDEAGDVDLHEFIELHNRGNAPVALGGWRLGGEVAFTIPDGTTLEPGKQLVVAKDRAALLAVAKYALDPKVVVGNYEKELDNGSGRLVLADAAGKTIDQLTYNSRFPWPIGPDALGAGDDWLASRPGVGKASTHRFMGISLERVSAEVVSAELANWAPSPLDGATPGKPNASAGAPLPVVEALTALPMGRDLGDITATDMVKVSARFSALGSVKSPEIELWIEDWKTGERTISKIPMTPAASPAGAGPTFEALLPPAPENSVVRYRVAADRGRGRAVVAPRPSDPMEAFSYWVTSKAVPADAYQVFIRMKDWEQLYTNLVGGMVFETRQWVSGCEVNPRWDDRVPATFVARGQVFDARVRFAGSRWNRFGGLKINGWPDAERPKLPANFPSAFAPNTAFQVVSWNVKLPRYTSFEGRRTIYINKLAQSCTGMQPALGARLFEAAGIGAPRVRRFQRLYVNGRYFHYTMDIEHADGDMLSRVYGKGADKAPAELVKANSGSSNDEGPYGYADLSPVKPNPTCPKFTLAERYAATWERKIREHLAHDELHKMFTELEAAQRAGVPQVRAFYEKYFDVPKVTTYLAIRNWSAAWDDTYHNFQLYKQPASGKWMLLPLDMDLEFGGAQFDATSSFYVGTGFTGKDPKAPRLDKSVNDYGQLGFYKITFLGAFKAEFEAKLVELSQPGKLLHPDSVNKLLDEEQAKYSVRDAMASPAWSPHYIVPALTCELDKRVAQMKAFIQARHMKALALKK
jgi:hypothetical protein